MTKINPNLSSCPTLYAIPISSPCTHLCTHMPNYTRNLIISNCCCSSVTKSCPTRCNPMNCNPPDSSVHGIFQARILQWVAIFFSRRASWPRNRTHISWIGRQILYCLSHMGSPIYHDFCLNWHLHNLRCICCCLVAKSCLTLCDPMDCSILGFTVLHYLLELAQTYVLWVDYAIRPSYPLSPPLLLHSVFPSITGLSGWLSGK